MIPILLDYDQQQHDTVLAFANQDLALYNALLAAINTAVPGLDLDIAGFTALLNNPQLAAFENIVGGDSLVIGGVTISQPEAMKMVALTPGWVTIIGLVVAFNADFQTNTVYKYFSMKAGNKLVNRLPIANIEIVSGVFALTSAYTTALTAKYSIYTTTDNQNAVYALLNDIYTACNSLKALQAGITASVKLSQLGITNTLGGTTMAFNPTTFVLQN